MQIYKKPKESNNNNEYLKMTSSIKSDPINNVCFECGEKDPQYISINNAIFICKDCVVNHFSFSQEISQIIINDLYALNLSEVKMLYLGGNRKLIQYINFDYPGLKQLPPYILYKTLAVDYYRQNLKFIINGGKRPIKPNNQFAYNLLEDFGNNNYIMNKSEKKREKYFNSELTTIFEGKDENDEKDNNEENKAVIENNKNIEEIKEQKENLEKKIDTDITKNESTLINTPQKNINKGNNNSAIINTSNSLFSKSFQNEQNKNNNFNTIINRYNNKNFVNEYKNKILDEGNEEIKNNLNINEEIKFNIDKNISEIVINNEENENSSNFNLKSSDINISGDDNTIKIVKGYINDFSDIKSNKENNCDSSNSLIKEEINEIKEKSEKQKIKNNNEINDLIIINNDNKIKNDIKSNKKIIENERKINDEMVFNNKRIKVNKRQKYNNSFKENKKEKYKSNIEENKYDNNYDDINYDDIKINLKNLNDNNNKIKNDNKSRKNKIVKKKDYLSSEEESEEKEEEDEIKSEKIIYKKQPEEKISKLNLTEIKPNKYLKARIYSSKIIENNNSDKENNEDGSTKKKKTKKILNKKERTDKYVTSKEIIKKNKKDLNKNDDFFSKKSKFGSGFINPLKYLQKSFQKKQNEKFEKNSDSSEGEEEESDDDEEIKNKRNRNKKLKIKIQSKRYNTFVDKKSYNENRYSDDEEFE